LIFAFGRLSTTVLMFTKLFQKQKNKNLCALCATGVILKFFEITSFAVNKVLQGNGTRKDIS
jgi:hypothetical protein